MYGFNDNNKSYLINSFASIGWTDPFPDFIQSFNLVDTKESYKELIKKIKIHNNKCLKENPLFD